MADQTPHSAPTGEPGAWHPVWALVAEVDAVMTEHDAMHDNRLRVGMGRIHRAWKAWRRAVE